GRLARAGRPHDRDVVAAFDGEGDAAQGVHRGLARAVHLGHLPEVEDRGGRDRRAHLSPPPSRPAGPPPPGPPPIGPPPNRGNEESFAWCAAWKRTTGSPSSRPDLISVVESPRRPTSTRRTTREPFSMTVTVLCPPAVLIAEVGTVSTFS